MEKVKKLQEILEKRGFTTAYFETSAQASDYLDSQIDGKTVGAGGSLTIKDMGLLERLSTHNEIYSHWMGKTTKEAAATQIYIASLNGVAETGELINIDGTCNRVASGLFGHEKIYFVVGTHKIAPDYDSALWRARNIAAPKNAQRLAKKTPCAAKGDKCYDCQSPERICNALVVYWGKPGALDVEVVFVNEPLGY